MRHDFEHPDPNCQCLGCLMERALRTTDVTSEELWAAKRKTRQAEFERDQMCPDCRKPNKLTRAERRYHKHCAECTEQAQAMMAPACHVIFSV